MGAFIVAANAVIVTAPSQLKLPGDDDRTPFNAHAPDYYRAFGLARGHGIRADSGRPRRNLLPAGCHEVGSCLRLAADSTFEYFLAYGAYDENSKGCWKVDGAEVVLDSPPYDKAPTFTFKGFEPAAGDGFDIAVVNAAGNRINGINVREPGRIRGRGGRHRGRRLQGRLRECAVGGVA